MLREKAPVSAVAAARGVAAPSARLSGTDAYEHDEISARQKFRQLGAWAREAAHRTVRPCLEILRGTYSPGGWLPLRLHQSLSALLLAVRGLSPAFVQPATASIVIISAVFLSRPRWSATQAQPRLR